VVLVLSIAVVQGNSAADIPFVWVCGILCLIPLLAFYVYLGSLVESMGYWSAPWVILTVLTTPIGVVVAYLIMLVLVIRQARDYR